MNEICGDNRFEIIAKAKAHLLDATNIDTSEDEMKVIDSFLFRCWQMGWLDRYAEQTESNCSEKPNNCEYEDIFEYCPRCGMRILVSKPKDEPQTDCFLCKWLGEVDVCGRCRNRNLFAEADTEPQTDVWEYHNGEWTEPQTDCAWK